LFLAETRVSAQYSEADADPLAAQAEPVSDHCDIAVIIPVFQQPGFLPEAVASVLAQRGGLGIAAVIVDDGCPMAETRDTGLALARSHPGRVLYVRRRNGGLSAARNTGIDLALAAWPGCRAIYFLDADNRLRPDFLRRAWDVLESSPAEVGWAYPDVDMFGYEMNFSVRGEYSHFLHLVENYCEAGSLARRSVFERGLRFDENMRQGFEDWEFWLSCAQHGFIGRHVPQSGFQYRRRAESMLTGSERVRDSILSYMRRKHAAALRPAALLALEHREVPRFAMVTGSGADVRLTADPRPGHGRAIPPACCDANFASAVLQPRAQHFPAVCCFAAPGVLEALEPSRLLPGLFWMAQVMLAEHHLVAVEVAVSGTECLGLEPLPRLAGGAEAAAAPVILANTQILGTAAASGVEPAWFTAPEAERPPLRIGLLRVTLPRSLAAAAAAMPAPQAARLLLDMVARWGEALRHRAPRPEDWREDARRLRASTAEGYALLAGLGAVLPLLAPADRRDIGFLLPLCAFGGVEKVVLNQARVMRQAGWRPHLFITAAQTAQLTAEQREVFHSVSFLLGQGEDAADWNRLHMGAGTAAFGQRGGPAHALGLLSTMAVVLNTHAMAGHALVAGLRRQGVKTFLGLHLVERSGFGQPMGNPHIALAYEHAYDGFVVISRQLRDWCAGQAVPRDKLHLVPNAPSYPADEAALRRVLAQRPQRTGRLRVLYLGRLDPQKGLDRLAGMILRTRGRSADWRVVGHAVVGSAEAELAAAGIVPEPAVAHPGELDQLYAWADVVVLPSRFEGVPLTVLEAQRLGCVVVATDVGAVAEAVADGRDGFLVAADAPEREIVEAFVGIIDRLAGDRALLARIGAAAAARLAPVRWDRNMAGFVAHLEHLLENQA
jgi:glycosyltransferase involved in cell wall biosynthesis